MDSLVTLIFNHFEGDWAYKPNLTGISVNFRPIDKKKTSKIHLKVAVKNYLIYYRIIRKIYRPVLNSANSVHHAKYTYKILVFSNHKYLNILQRFLIKPWFDLILIYKYIYINII